MTLVDLLAELAEKDIQLWLDDGQLRFSAPDGAMTDALIQQIRDIKPAIIDFLYQSSHAQQPILKAENNRNGYPASFSQQRFWLLQQLEPQSTAYHIHSTLKLKGSLNTTKLQDAFEQLVKANVILRTGFDQMHGVLTQRICAIEPKLVSTQTTEKEAQEAVERLINQPFDLTKGEVIRAALFALNPEEYLFSFVMHHIASDGISLQLMIQALMQSYSLNIAPQTPPLQYADFSVWQQTQNLDQQRDYWTNQLQNTPVLNLPYDKSIAFHGENNSAAFCDISLNATHYDVLKQIALRENTTLFVVLIAAYAILLEKYCQQQDFAIGTPVSGRNRSELEGMLGCFINSLALRVDLDPALTFSDFLAQTKQTTVDALKHQDIPFEAINQALALTTDLNTPPVFQTLFSLQPTDGEAINIDNLTMTPVPQKVDVQFDLKLTAMEGSDTLHLRFEYKKSRFSEAKMGRMATQLVYLLKTLDNHAKTPISQLRLTDTTHSLYLSTGEFNDTQTLRKAATLHGLFEQQVEKTPDQVATSDSQTCLTYRALNERANQFSHFLLAQGVEKNNVVGIRMNRSVSILVAQLALLKAGCAYLPLEKELPPERQAQMLNKAQVSHIITDEEHAFDGIRSFNLAVFEGDTYSTSNLDIHAPDNLLNVIFTSGSTGEPKGVMVSHRAIANRLQWMQKQFVLNPTDKVLQKTPYGFDVSVWEFFWPLITGSCCHFLAPDAHKDPQALTREIASQNITHIHFVPSMLTPFLAKLDQPLPSLRKIFCSGEALTQPQVERCLDVLPNIELFNLYGPTEAAIDVSFYPCKKDDIHLSVPIGKPIDNMQLHVIDNSLTPVPFGVGGELFIGGTGLAEGYIHSPEITEKAFIDNPFSNHPSAKLYRTGDLVKMSEDGELLYLGRSDGQVKIRGQRIELSDIEQTLIAQLGIDQAVVLAKQDPKQGDKTLVAYVPINDTSTIKAQLTQSLSAAMLPSYFVSITAWPLTASGKIDRKRLPEPAWQDVTRAVYQPPTTDTEKTLATLWQEVLGIEKIGIHDNFFDLGGHSLKAVEIMMKTQEHFAIDLSLKSVLSQPTIAAISEWIDQVQASKAVFVEHQDNEDTDSFIL